VTRRAQPDPEYIRRQRNIQALRRTPASSITTSKKADPSTTTPTKSSAIFALRGQAIRLFCATVRRVAARRARSRALSVKPPLWRTARVVLRTPRSASLTAASVGNALAISGSMRTTFVPLRSRRTYFPRTPPYMEAKSYSARSSSLSLAFFFIKPTLTPRGFSRADQPDPGVRGMRHDENPSLRRLPDCEESLLGG